MSRIPGAAARRLVVPALLALLGQPLDAGSARVQIEAPTSPGPDWRTCDPDLEPA